MDVMADPILIIRLTNSTSLDIGTIEDNSMDKAIPGDKRQVLPATSGLQSVACNVVTDACACFKAHLSWPVVFHHFPERSAFAHSIIDVS